MFDISAFLSNFKFYIILISVIAVILIFILISVIAVILILKFSKNVLKTRDREIYINKVLNNQGSSDEINKYCNSVKDKTDKVFLVAIEKKYNKILKERIVLKQNFKLLLHGIIIGIVSSILGAYIVHITLNGLDSLPIPGSIVFAICLITLLYLVTNIIIEFQDINVTLRFLKNPTTRNFITTQWIEMVRKEFERRKNKKK